MAALVFFAGTMDCGKSTLALQTNHNHAVRGRSGLVFTRLDRLGEFVLSSRLGLTTAALEVSDDTDFFDEVVSRRTRGRQVDYLVCDEAHFYSPEQVEQLARVVDDLDVDVFAFGITTDFRTRLFPGSRRLVELADRVETLQVAALCWCGARATHNARTVDGIMVVEGPRVLIGDVQHTARVDRAGADNAGADNAGADNAGADNAGADNAGADNAGGGRPPVTEPGHVGYETLCRRHHTRRMTAPGPAPAAADDAARPIT